MNQQPGRSVPHSEILKVLLVDNNPEDASMVREMLAEVNGDAFSLECTGQLSTGLARLAKGDIDMVFLDLSLPDSRGLDTFSRAHAKAPLVPIIVLTGLDDEQVAVQAVRKGAKDYLVKGHVDSNLLVRAMHYAVKRKRAVEEVQPQLHRA
jgi:CheY-like chemotaxis protein